jgi:hypothetical protein
MARMVPPGYETLSEARRRAERKWGDNARVHLLGLLVPGQLQAYLVDEAGSPYPFPKEDWPGAARLLRMSTARLNEMWAAPVFLKSDLDREIPDTHPYTIAGRRELKLTEMAKRGEKEGAEQTAVAPKSKGGHPTNYDWDTMWIEIVRIALYDSFPEKPAELRKKLHDWFSETGRKIPGDTMMKKKMRALFAILDAEEAKKGDNQER